LNAVDLTKKFQFCKGQDEEFGRVNDLFGNEEVFIVAHDQGRLNIYRKDDDAPPTEWEHEKIVEFNRNPLKSLKLSAFRNTLVVFEENQDDEDAFNNVEYLHVFDIKKQDKMFSEHKIKNETKFVYKESLDTNEHSKYPDVSSKLY